MNAEHVASRAAFYGRLCYDFGTGLVSRMADLRGKSTLTEKKLTGTVKSFDLAKGFGYIRTDDVSEPVFVHYESIVDDPYRMLGAGDKVEFVLYGSSTGPRAVEVKKL